jgi:hypothetical protein
VRTKATLCIGLSLVWPLTWGSVATADSLTAGDQRWVSVYTGGGQLSLGRW